MAPPELLLTTAAPAWGPDVDQAVSLALLHEVAAGALPGAVRVWRPAPALVLGRLDGRLPGAPAAVAAARRRGVPAVQRVSGGRATLLTAGSLCVGVGEPAAGLGGATERYERLVAALLGVLAEAGIAARRGELEGEWCPGAWSLHAGGRKLAGLAQRAIRGGAWTEAVLSVTPAPGEAELLAEVYAALELPFASATVGAASELAPAAAAPALAGALVALLAPGATPRDGPRPETLAAAATLAAGFTPPA